MCALSDSCMTFVIVLFAVKYNSDMHKITIRAIPSVILRLSFQFFINIPPIYFCQVKKEIYLNFFTWHSSNLCSFYYIIYLSYWQMFPQNIKRRRTHIEYVGVKGLVGVILPRLLAELFF